MSSAIKILKALSKLKETKREDLDEARKLYDKGNIEFDDMYIAEERYLVALEAMGLALAAMTNIEEIK